MNNQKRIFLNFDFKHTLWALAILVVVILFLFATRKSRHLNSTEIDADKKDLEIGQKGMWW